MMHFAMFQADMNAYIFRYLQGFFSFTWILGHQAGNKGILRKVYFEAQVLNDSFPVKKFQFFI